MPASRKKVTPAEEALTFASAAAWRTWLGVNHDLCTGVWMRVAKKAAKDPTVTYAQALDEALCFGWIDGQKKPLDAAYWLQRFTPRRPRGRWSRRNTEHVERLLAEGKMAPPGLGQVEAAKADGRWSAAYDSPARSAVPEDLLSELRKNPKSMAFFKTLNRANIYAITYRLQTAKRPRTRQKWMELILEMLADGKKFH